MMFIFWTLAGEILRGASKFLLSPPNPSPPFLCAADADVRWRSRNYKGMHEPKQLHSLLLTLPACQTMIQRAQFCYNPMEHLSILQQEALQRSCSVAQFSPHLRHVPRHCRRHEAALPQCLGWQGKLYLRRKKVQRSWSREHAHVVRELGMLLLKSTFQRGFARL